MSTLAQIQRDLGAAIRSDDAIVPGLAVYRNTYRAQMLACMDETFPVLSGHLGEERFTALAIAYALECPPASWSLDHFPARFTPWLAQGGEEALRVDLARIEWALTLSFVAPDEPVIAPTDMAGINWDSAVLQLTRSCHLLPLASSAASVWVAAQDRQTGAQDGPTAEAVLIWRQSELCQLRELTSLEAGLLAACPASFETLCDLACAQLGEAQGIAKAGRLLGQWVANGLLSLRADP